MDGRRLIYYSLDVGMAIKKKTHTQREHAKEGEKLADLIREHHWKQPSSGIERMKLLLLIASNSKNTHTQRVS